MDKIASFALKGRLSEAQRTCKDEREPVPHTDGCGSDMHT